MIEYFENGDLAVFNGGKFRRDKRTGYYLSSKPIEGKRRRLHVVVWEHANGGVPARHHVHHIDEDKDNNELDNLELLSDSYHMHYHSAKYATENHDKIIQNLNNNARPKAIEWHKSDKGRKWHSEHAKETTANLVPQKYICESCGTSFYRKPLGQKKFCSNSCKSTARRISGVDNAQKTCEYCGGDYVGNKYQKTKYCSSACKDGAREKRKTSRTSECVQHGSREAS